MINNELKQWLEQERFVVLGAGVSGLAAARLLKSTAGRLLVVDQGKRIEHRETIEELDALDVPSAWGDEAFSCALLATVLVLSPGISRANPIVKRALEKGIKVIAEVELAAKFMRPNDKLIAITGTNGKTTTTAWTAHILREAGMNVCCGGNIGQAWSSLIATLPDAPVCHVIELSSYQLESIELMKPDVAMITNITPDHLERYGNMEAYANAKHRIIMNMGAGDFVLFHSQMQLDWYPYTGYTEACDVGDEPETDIAAYTDADGYLTLQFKDKTERLLAMAELPIPGKHNVDNALFAALGARLVGAPVEAIVRGLRTFCAVEHRIELCGQWRGIRFFNDSKATNVDSLEKALASFPDNKVVLIAGGVHKHAPYTPLRELVTRNVRAVVTIGEAAPIIETDWADCGVTFSRADSMHSAVRQAIDLAVEGDVVMLSPACASFDWYPMPGGGFEARGRDFKNIVAELTAQ